MPFCRLQRAQTAFAAHDYGAARHWFELVRTWSPASAAVPLAACEAAGAAGRSTVSAPGPSTAPAAAQPAATASQQSAASAHVSILL